MRFTREDIRRVARSLLAALSEQGISVLRDVEDRIRRTGLVGLEDTADQVRDAREAGDAGDAEEAGDAEGEKREEKPVGDYKLFESGEMIRFETLPSSRFLESVDSTISYVCNGDFVPVEIRLNRGVGWAGVTLRCFSVFEKYSVSGEDNFGNKVQQREFERPDFGHVKSEIERIAGSS